jgi:hypothetical protein
MFILRITSAFALVVSGWLLNDHEYWFAAFMLFVSASAALNSAILGGALRRIGM